MAVLIDIYQARSLTAALNLVRPPAQFLLDKVFSKREMKATDNVDYEVINQNQTVAKFTSKEGEAHHIKNESYHLKQVRIPRTYEMKTFEAEELAKFKPVGGGDLYFETPEQRAAASNGIVIQELETLKNRVLRRREQMAVEGLTKGTITIDDGYVNQVADFGYVDGTHKTALTSTARWGQSAADIISNLRTWKRKIMLNSGHNANILLLGTAAAEEFIKSAAVLAQLDANNNKVGTRDLTMDSIEGATPIGRMLGLEIYEYAQEYTNASGTSVPMMETNRATLLSTKSAGFRMFQAPIAVINSNNEGVQFISTDMYLNAIVSDDSRRLQWGVDQKSIPVVLEPGAVFTATVLG